MKEICVAFVAIEKNHREYSEKTITVHVNTQLNDFLDSHRHRVMITAESGELESEVQIYLKRIIRINPEFAKYLIAEVFVPIKKRTQSLHNLEGLVPVIEFSDRINLVDIINENN